MLTDYFCQGTVFGQSNDILGIRLFHISIDFRFREGGICTEGRCDTTFGIPLVYGIYKVFPVIGAVLIAGTQRTAFQHLILVEREERVVTFAFEITVVFALLLLAVDLAG